MVLTVLWYNLFNAQPFRCPNEELGVQKPQQMK